MATRDIVEIALNSPIDWNAFESLVAEVLQQDDIPRLRKIGGRADEGIDAIDQAFFNDEARTEAIVQVTSQRAQVEKFKATVSQLRKKAMEFRVLIIVYRHPVASTVRNKIQSAALESGIAVDIRDQSYLIAQLSKVGSSLFTRYFEDIGTQVRTLLAASDPLQISSDHVRNAILASIGAYVLNPHARIARSTLFEKTVLAVIVSLEGGTVNDILEKLKLLMPGEQIVESRVRSALDSLSRSDEISLQDQTYVAKDEALMSVGRIMAASQMAYEGLRDFILEKCSNVTALDEASRGYLERNLRRAALILLRNYGPIAIDDSSLCIDRSLSIDLLQCFARDLSPEIARAALISFGAYVENKENTANLAALARTYAALAIRNLDPLGRRWQRETLSRSLLALDTDAVLSLIIKELPEHGMILDAVRAFREIGMKVVVSESVLRETIVHITRADRSYSKFQGRLLRMSPAMVDAQVWHAVVRGFYYASGGSDEMEWESYWRRYYDHSNAEGYIRFMLGKSANVTIETLDGIPEDWFPALEEITAHVHEHKEPHRLKAEFRDDDQRRLRAYEDVRMAMHLAHYETRAAGASAKGYIVSEDRGFLKAQLHPAWSPRPDVLIFTHSLPELAGFLCGTMLDDDQVVRLLFDPVVTSAATLMEKEISTLTSLGVNLRAIGLARLEWDLSTGLLEALSGYQETTSQDLAGRISGAMHVLKKAEASDLPIEPTIRHLAKSYSESIKNASQERMEHDKLESIIKRLALAAGSTKKAKRRVNQVLKEIGIQFSDLVSDD